MKFIHLSETKIEKFKTPTNLGRSFKPSGTLWFACDNSWKEYVEEHEFEIDYTYTYEAKLNLDTLITLKTKKDIKNFSEKFGILENNKYYGVDWNRVKKETGKAGIFIVNPSIFSARQEYLWYSSFDVCSVAVWNKNAIAEMKLVR